jgi:hypothetical protein
MTNSIDNKGVVVFLGSANAMPMMYALELKSLGYQVLYFVDAKQSVILHRPECHFPTINYPYPDWVIEMPLHTQLQIALFPKHYARRIDNIIKKKTSAKVNCYILNGFFVSLIKYLPIKPKKLALTHGADFIQWADIDSKEEFSESFSKFSVFKYIPKLVSKLIIKKMILNQFTSYKNSDAIISFPRGMNSKHDLLLQKVDPKNKKFIPRHDISFLPLLNVNRDFKPRNQKLILLSAVRFSFEKFVGDSKGRNKGNDIIIRGIAEYYKLNNNIEVHFIEKGQDTSKAKYLCKQYGLDSCVKWHKEMPLKSLFKLYTRADICFDQVGDHWISAVGCYALWLGKPLIANSENLIESEVWPKKTPVCSAKNVKDIVNGLQKLEDDIYRERVSKESKAFAEKYISPEAVVSKIVSFLPENA